MSIYATLWILQFPKYGDDYLGCEWTRVMAQGVPAHIGSPTAGCGYDAGDPYAAFEDVSELWICYPLTEGENHQRD